MDADEFLAHQLGTVYTVLFDTTGTATILGRAFIFHDRDSGFNLFARVQGKVRRKHRLLDDEDKRAITNHLHYHQECQRGVMVSRGHEDAATRTTLAEQVGLVCERAANTWLEPSVRGEMLQCNVVVELSSAKMPKTLSQKAYSSAW